MVRLFSCTYAFLSISNGRTFTTAGGGHLRVQNVRDCPHNATPGHFRQIGTKQHTVHRLISKICQEWMGNESGWREALAFTTTGSGSGVIDRLDDLAKTRSVSHEGLCNKTVVVDLPGDHVAREYSVSEARLTFLNVYKFSRMVSFGLVKTLGCAFAPVGAKFLGSS